MTNQTTQVTWQPIRLRPAPFLQRKFHKRIYAQTTATVLLVFELQLNKSSVSCEKNQMQALTIYIIIPLTDDDDVRIHELHSV